MLEIIFAQIEAQVSSMEAEVKKRRMVTAVDPVADTTEYYAGEIRSLLGRLKKDTEMLSPRQYAELHKTTPQTVTAWCRSGKLEGAVPNGRSYLIPRTAQAPKRRKKVA